MRKEKKQNKNVRLSTVDSYHSNRNCHSGNYAYNGFESNKYFTSDRFIKLDAIGNDLVRPDGKQLKGFGLEVESECWGILNQDVYAEFLDKVVFSNFPTDLFKLQNDCTLSAGNCSAEIISQIMTKDFIRNNYQNFKVMFNTYFPAIEASCSRSGHCGMHVNISNGVFGKTQDVQYTAIRKLYYFINKNYNLCCDLFYRKRTNTGWCGRMNFDNAKTLDLENNGSNHRVCFNLGHVREGRIEIRLVGGQKDFACFRNTMESIFWLCDVVKRISWCDLDDVTKVFAGCNQYVHDRLKTYCLEAGSISAEDVAKIGENVKIEELL